jgi:hypothetical protein
MHIRCSLLIRNAVQLQFFFLSSLTLLKFLVNSVVQLNWLRVLLPSSTYFLSGEYKTTVLSGGTDSAPGTVTLQGGCFGVQTPVVVQLLYSSFLKVKRPRHGVNHPTSSSAEVKERVVLYLYSPSGTSWPVLGWTLPLFLYFICHIIRFIHDVICVRLNVRIPDCTLNGVTVSLSSYNLSNFYDRTFYKISWQSTLFGSYPGNIKPI